MIQVREGECSRVSAEQELSFVLPTLSPYSEEVVRSESESWCSDGSYLKHCRVCFVGIKRLFCLNSNNRNLTNLL